MTTSDRGGAPELSARALVSGCLVGAVLAMTNVFMGLKAGWNDSGNITACIAGFAIMATWSRRRAVAPTELNTAQSAATMASAIGFTSGIGAAIPALALLGYGVSSWTIVFWAAGLSLCGIAIAFVRSERLFALDLRFPTSVAVAQLVDTFGRAASSGMAQARALAAATGIAGAITWFRDGRPAWIPGFIGVPLAIKGFSGSALTLGLGMNPMMLGGGALLGLQIGLSVLGGSLIAYVWLGPMLLQRHLVAGSDYVSLLTWLLWPGVGLMLASTLTSFALDLLVVARLRGGRAAGLKSATVAPLFALGAVGALVVLIVGWLSFGLALLPALVALAISVPLAEAAMRAYGETDLAAVGPTGTLVQIGSASTVARAPMQNLPLGNIAAGVTSHASASILALKIGSRLGASRRPQLIAQLLGTIVGIATAVPAYMLITKAYRIGGQQIPAPGVMPWKAVAEAAQRGTAVMPPHAAGAAIAALVAGVLLTVVGRTRRFQAYTPSPTAMGMGMLVPQYYASTICLGAIVAALTRWRARQWATRNLEATASGLIVGESVVGVVIAALIAFGVLGG